MSGPLLVIRRHTAARTRFAFSRSAALLLVAATLSIVTAAAAPPPQIPAESTLLPASATASSRCQAYLTFAGKENSARQIGKIDNKAALGLPGMLASIIDVKDGNDPRLSRFMEDTRRVLTGLRDGGSRLGPFEIFFPIANHVAAKRILGATFTSHPSYREYEKAVLEHQSRWADYKSTGSDAPKKPIPQARTLADVPTNIDNGNFRLLVTAAGYLSAQEFPQLETRYLNPKTNTEVRLTRDQILTEMTLYTRRVYHSIASRNTWEYGSQTYLAIDFAPIHVMALYAADPKLREIATGTLDCLYSSLAASINQGHYIHSAGRSKGEFLGTGSGLGFIAWLKFGDGKPRSGNTTPFLIYTALPHSYQPPPPIRPSADLPFVKREKIGSGSNWVCTYTYQSRSFGLASSIESRSPSSRQSPSWDRDGFYKEAGRHKLNWLGANPGGFVPQWQNSNQPYAGRRNKPNGNYYGLNPWSQVIQCEGTQIGLADVSEGYPFRQLYTIYQDDGSIRKRTHHPQTGWTICHTGSTLFAFRSLKPATSSKTTPSGKPSFTEFYDYKKTAWILEVVDAPISTAQKTEAVLDSEIARFHATLTQAKIEAPHLDDSDPASPVMTYTSPITHRTLRLDAAVYPIAADGEGILMTDYPILQTYPKKPGSPSVKQNPSSLVWLDREQKPIHQTEFDSWIR